MNENIVLTLTKDETYIIVQALTAFENNVMERIPESDFKTIENHIINIVDKIGKVIGINPFEEE